MITVWCTQQRHTIKRSLLNPEMASNQVQILTVLSLSVLCTLLKFFFFASFFYFYFLHFNRCVRTFSSLHFKKQACYLFKCRCEGLSFLCFASLPALISSRPISNGLHSNTWKVHPKVLSIDACDVNGTNWGTLNHSMLCGDWRGNMAAQQGQQTSSDVDIPHPWPCLK